MRAASFDIAGAELVIKIAALVDTVALPAVGSGHFRPDPGPSRSDRTVTSLV
jgi:hypothetical protein